MNRLRLRPPRGPMATDSASFGDGGVHFLPMYSGDGYGYGGGVIVTIGSLAIHMGEGSNAERVGHLLAAAPVLLEACQRTLEMLESIEAKTLVGDEGCLWGVEIVRHAIAKARGEQT